jgi:hypothetical protein
MATYGSVMARTGRAAGAWRRFALVAVGLATLLAAPTLVAAIPATDSDISALELWQRVRASTDVAYSGYAEPTSRLSLPDVPAVGGVLELLGETTPLRVWWVDREHWRVDELLPTGERNHVHHPGGAWLWNSPEQRATQVTGDPAVRLLRAADLVPPELGRRLAGAGDAASLQRLPARRVAGHSAVGLRLRATDPGTTIDHVDLWAHERTGLPVEVQVYAVGGGRQPILETRFLDLDLDVPSRDVLDFSPPPGADVDVTSAADIAAAVDQFSLFVVPDVVAGRARRSRIASGAGTYGDGFALVGVLTLDGRNYRRARRRVSETLAPTESGPFGEGFVITTPLINGMLVEARNGASYALAGTVTPDVLRELARGLAETDPELRRDLP